MLADGGRGRDARGRADKDVGTDGAASDGDPPQPVGTFKEPVAPDLLTAYLSQYENDPNVPEAAVEAFARGGMLDAGVGLRDSILDSWASRGTPLEPSAIFDRARALTASAGAACLVAHNVLRTFGKRPSNMGTPAIAWERYEEDGRVKYRAGDRVIAAPFQQHPDGRPANDPNGQGGIFHHLFSFTSPVIPPDDPNDWYHFFLTATIAALSAEGSVGKAVLWPSFSGANQYGYLLYKLVLVVREEMRILNLFDGQFPTNGFLWANALSFLEGLYYGIEQADTDRESLVHLRGALFGDRAAGARSSGSFRWFVPAAGGFGTALEAVADQLFSAEGLQAILELAKQGGIVARCTDHVLTAADGAVTVEVTPSSRLSGAHWVGAYPGSRSLDDLEEPSRSAARGFVSALRSAGAKVRISATYRPTERAWLMHHAWKVARGEEDPASVVDEHGTGILWAHPDDDSSFTKSRAAAAAMVSAYDLVSEPSLTSRHIIRRAIDMTISWDGPSLNVQRGDGSTVAISSQPRTGENADLQAVGASWGLLRLVPNDPPHWSDTGH